MLNIMKKLALGISLMLVFASHAFDADAKEINIKQFVYESVVDRIVELQHQGRIELAQTVYDDAYADVDEHTMVQERQSIKELKSIESLAVEDE